MEKEKKTRTRKKYYRTIPEVVEAVCLTAKNIPILTRWCFAELIVVGLDPKDREKPIFGLKVPTRSGDKKAVAGDYILRCDFKGFDVMKPQEFFSKYEAAQGVVSDKTR